MAVHPVQNGSPLGVHSFGPASEWTLGPRERLLQMVSKPMDLAVNFGPPNSHGQSPLVEFP